MQIVVRILVLVVALASASPARAEIKPDYEMLRDPVVPVAERVTRYSPKLVPLWQKALARPEDDLQRMTAETIARAHAAGMPGLAETVPALVKIVDAEKSRPAARFAACRTLIALGAKQTAPRLWNAAQRSPGALRQLVEPALAGWKHEPAFAVWRERLQASGTRHGDLVLAIRCLAAAGDSSAVEPLVSLSLDPVRTAEVRLEAARAAGLLSDASLDDAAARLLENPAKASIVHRLCAARLLARQQSERARSLLGQLAIDPEPTVAAAALARLLEIDPALVLPLAPQAMTNADAHVRQRGAEAYIQRPTPERVMALAKLLDDLHPAVRGSVREALYRLADQDQLDGAVRAGAMEVLGGSSWRGLEQANLLLAALDHKPAAGRIVELLEFPRDEVFVSAAWALKKLAVPETLPAMLDKARRQTEHRLKTGSFTPAIDEQVAHLFEAIGRMRYAPADELLRRYVPKSIVMGIFSRGAAIWALGFLYEGKPDDALAAQLFGSFIDRSGMPPEPILVVQMAGVTIGRMKAVSQLEPLRKFLSGTAIIGHPDIEGVWAISQLTGEPMPVLKPIVIDAGGFFLEPLADPPAASP